MKLNARGVWWWIVLAAHLALMAIATPSWAVTLEDNIKFNIPAGKLDAALVQFSRQAKLQFTTSAEEINELNSDALVGTFSVASALTKLLAGTGLSFRQVGASAIAIGHFGLEQKSATPAAPHASPAPDATADNSLLQEVIVTATKRSEAAQKVGIAITAFSSDQMKELGMVSSSDLALHTPGLQLQTSGGEGNTMSMTLRGVGQNDFNDHQESPVAIYIDEVYSSALTGTSFQAFDLERVEVLRGPQGTLFGRNATGGLVQFVTSKPTKDFQGFVNLGYGRFNDFTAEGAVSGPLTDSMQGRASFATHHRDQYFKNTLATGAGGNGKDDVAGRLQLQMQPAEGIDVRLVARGSDSRNSGPRGVPGAELYNEDGLPALLPADQDFWGTGAGNNPAGYRVRGTDPWTGAFDQYNPLTLSQWGTAAHVTATLGDITLFSITDYSHFKHIYREDTDLGPTRGEEYAATTSIGQVSQELRAQYDGRSVQAIAGAYYLNIDGDYRNEFLSRTPFVGITSPPVNVGPEGSGSLMNWSLRTISYSAFSQIDWSLLDTLKLIVGARWTRDEKHDVLRSDQIPLQLGQDVLTPGDPGLVTLLDYDNRRSDGFWSWKAGVNWAPTRNLLWFGSVTRGQKAGGYSVPFFVSNPDTLSFNPEQLTSYETGVKWSNTGILRRVNVSVYHYDYRDYQAYEFVTSIGAIFNVDAEIDGAEAELIFTPVEAMTLQLGSALVFNAKVKNIGLPSGRQTDTRVPQTPNLSLSALVRYDWPTHFGTLSLQADGHYQSSQYFDAFNSPVNREPGYGLANLRMFLTAPGKKLSTSIYIENLTNEDYRTFALDAGGFAQQWLGVPRTYGIQTEYRF
jgi:iron complex outermembrane receptor protein